MNTGTIRNIQEPTFLPDVLKISPTEFVYDAPKDDKLEEQRSVKDPQSNRLFHFVTELRRRRVCRAITMYSVAMWLVCQIVDVISPELGLPEWTLKFVILLGLLGLPIALILSWLFEITPNGLVVESGDRADHPPAINAEPRRRLDQIIDCSLLLAASIIGIQLAAGVLSTDSNAAHMYQQRIAVTPFRVASGNDAARLSEGLVIELQHELASQAHITVIAGKDPYLSIGGLNLTGAVAVGEHTIRITATMVDNKTGAVTWSKVFERPRSDALSALADFAREIVAALPEGLQIAATEEPEHAI